MVITLCAISRFMMTTLCNVDSLAQPFFIILISLSEKLLGLGSCMGHFFFFFFKTPDEEVRSCNSFDYKCEHVSCEFLTFVTVFLAERLENSQFPEKDCL